MKISLGFSFEVIVDGYRKAGSGSIQIFGEVMTFITQPETYLGIFVNPVMIFKADRPAVFVMEVMA